ncbi:bifunctional coenzyme A synthase [Lutzomyia longipalpis]|uniref:bifunctional coenzyme A synthase n=1 Tax=Lutzomyia longipalpis TaxID=7200 RepID=UPI002483780B|nr:bifunctional coenzyme A synthase [Lutzomyia longipalpis]
MAKTGLLLTSSLARLPFCLQAARKHVAKTLYIQIEPRSSNIQCVPIYSTAINRIYTSSSIHCNHLDVRVLITNLRGQRVQSLSQQVDVLMFDADVPQAEATLLAEGLRAPSVVQLENPEAVESQGFTTEDGDSPDSYKMHDNVVLGGTFDRLHMGHKILLSNAVLRAKKRLVVGVTDASMVKSKKLPELILPVDQRINDVTNFLKDIDHSLRYEVVPISDPFGPTATDPDMDLIVVSQETQRGGEKVNELRQKNNLNKLQIHCIGMLEGESVGEEDKEVKISSSNQRMDLLGTRIREPEPKGHLEKHPYLIGLLGGIASGKSIMCERFKRFGAAVIDCDKLAHSLYEPGTECFNALKEHFGAGIVGSDGKIDRKILGSIVFSQKEKLEELNGIVWPKLLDAVKVRIEEIRKQGQHRVVFIEAAVLLKAGWQNHVHEVWSLIIPPEEAIRRLQERNNLTEEEAKMRINSQLSNDVIVQHSNVVFSSQWSYEFTEKQAVRAWEILMKDLDTCPEVSSKI